MDRASFAPTSSLDISVPRQAANGIPQGGPVWMCVHHSRVPHAWAHCSVQMPTASGMVLLRSAIHRVRNLSAPHAKTRGHALLQHVTG